MKRFEFSEINALLDAKYARGEVMFREGDMQGAVKELYTENARYLTAELKVLNGRDEILAFFNQIKSQIGVVKVHPVSLWGDPEKIIYQFCNTVRRAPGGGQISHAHYLAAFRQVGNDWLCEMEVVAQGHIDVAAVSAGDQWSRA